MRDTAKKAARLGCAAVLASTCMAMTGCGVEAPVQVDVEGESVTVDATGYLTGTEEAWLTLYSLTGQAGQVGLEKTGTQVVDGTSYSTYRTSQLPKTIAGQEQLRKAGVLLDGGKVAVYPYTAASKADIDAYAPNQLRGYDFMDVTATFTKDVTSTNGELDGKRAVSWHEDALANGTPYATFTDEAASASDVTPTLADKSATRKATARFTSTGVIADIAVKGASAMDAGTLKLDAKGRVTAMMTKQGKNKVAVMLANGSVKSFTYTYDTKAPKANVKAGKAYKRGKKVKVTDATSGVKSIKLDGKKVKSGKKVAKKGIHKLAATDRAGNKLTVKFKVR